MQFEQQVPVRRVSHRGTALSVIMTVVLLSQSIPVAAAVTSIDSSRGMSSQGAATQEGMIEMFRGEARTLTIPGTIKRVAIGNGKILSANVVDGRLLLLAEGPGVTSLIAWNNHGVALETKVRVARSNVSESAVQLQDVLGAVPGLRVRPVGPNIVLSGSVHRDMLPLIKAATADMDNVIDTTTAEEGDALKKTVHFKVQIMEVSRTAQKKLGIAWDSQIAGPSISGNGQIATGAARAAAAGTGYFLAGIASTLASRINLALVDGDAYLLAAPELNAKSGGTATFLAGGEVPIPRAGALGTTDVQYKPYGIKLNIKPVVDSDNVISAKLETEISQIDPSVSFGGMPGFLTRRTQSDVSLRAGETLAISGLISADATDAVSKLPFLGQLPILGRLFRSDDFRSKKSDLVIFVTPLISDPSREPNTNLLSRAGQIDENYRSRYGDPSPLGEIQPEGKREKQKPEAATAVDQRVSRVPATVLAPVQQSPQLAQPAQLAAPAPITPRVLDVPLQPSGGNAVAAAPAISARQPASTAAGLLPGGGKRMPVQVDALGSGPTPVR